MRPQVIDMAPIQPVQRVERVRAQVTGTYTDRAKGFALTTWQLSFIVGLALVVVVRFFKEYHLLSFTTAVIFFAAFLVVWTLAFLAHTFVSPEGVELLETIFLWRFIRAEQKERHRRLRGGG